MARSWAVVIPPIRRDVPNREAGRPIPRHQINDNPVDQNESEQKMIDLIVFEDGTRHADDPTVPDFTICGIAFDAGESGDAEGMGASFNAKGTTNCPDCIKKIEAIKAIRGKWKADQ